MSMWHRRAAWGAPLALLLLARCASAPGTPAPGAAPPSAPGPRAASADPTAGAAFSADAALNAFFDGVFERRVARSPELQTRLGIRTDYGAWDDRSDARAREDHELAKQDLARLRSFPFEALSPEAKVSYRVFEYVIERRLEQFSWRFHTYAFSQMRGVHAWSAAFLINYHRVGSVKDAEAYVARLRGLRGVLAQLEENTGSAKNGASSPRSSSSRWSSGAAAT